MKRITLDYIFTYSQFIQEIREISFENHEIDTKNSTPNGGNFILSGKLEKLLVIEDLDVFVYVCGIPNFDWSLEIKIDGKPLTSNPIVGTLDGKGNCVYDKSYPV